MMNKCEALKKNGDPCSAWAMSNGYCRRHGGEKPVDEQEEEKVETQAVEVEASTQPTDSQEKKPAKKRRKKRKRKPKKCGALTSRGTPCTFKVIANSRCGKHQGAPDAPPEVLAASETVKKEEKTGGLKYSGHISSLIGKGEEVVFQEYFDLLHKDFNLNGSSDRMNSEIACIYYVKLLQAIKNDDTETISVLDQLLREKLYDLKAAK